MRKLLSPVLAAGLLFVAADRVRADDPKAVIEKAIKAYGGEEKLAQLRAMQFSAKGTVKLGADVPFTLETVWQWPDRLKNTVKAGRATPQTTLVEATTAEDAWTSTDGRVSPLRGPKLDELRSQAHVRRLLLLTPLLQDPAYELSALESIQVNDRPTAGVRVRAPSERDVKLYFDADTGLLAKLERRLPEDTARKGLHHEEFFSDYQESDGLPVARKQVWHRDGKKALDMTVTDVRFPASVEAAAFADPRPFTRRRDVVYGHKNGMALTLDAFTPKKGATGAAVVIVVSGGWVSNHDNIDTPFVMALRDELVKRGYVVFAVCHGSQPVYTIPDAVADLNRALRYVRLHSREFRIDPGRIGISGGSAGGHLSLMQGTAGDRGDPKAGDALGRTSSRVQAVACFYPPTDFLNYGEAGKPAFTEDGVLANFRTAIDVREFDKRTKRLEHLTDKQKLEALWRRVSPITHVSADDPPTLIIHGDADKLVPIQQAEILVAKLKKEGVPAELVVKKGAAHGWAGIDKDMPTIADWFDKYLMKK